MFLLIVHVHTIQYVLYSLKLCPDPKSFLCRAEEALSAPWRVPHSQALPLGMVLEGRSNWR